jgi:hypothetical protein
LWTSGRNETPRRCCATLGADKDKLLEQVRSAIAAPAHAHLRPAWARGL